MKITFFVQVFVMRATHICQLRYLNNDLSKPLIITFRRDNVQADMQFINLESFL